MPKQQPTLKFTLTESQSHFLQHTRILTKNKKTYQGKRKPVSNEVVEFRTAPRPSVINGVFTFLCHDCLEEYTDWDQHQGQCNPKPPAKVRCKQCSIEVDPWTHFEQMHQPQQKQQPYQTSTCDHLQLQIELAYVAAEEKAKYKRPKSQKGILETQTIRKELQRRRLASENACQTTENPS